MILAAGRGERLRPLTDSTPKPLIEVHGETLIERHLKGLANSGFHDVVINVAHLAETIERRIGSGAEFGLDIRYSREPDGALETAGGIANALPLLGTEPFAVINADIWTDFDFRRLSGRQGTAYVVLVPNPPHHPNGDFGLSGTKITHGTHNSHTYSGIGVFAPELFGALKSGARAPLGPLLFHAARRGELEGEVHGGRWYDIGTLQRLEHARAAIGAIGT